MNLANKFGVKKILELGSGKVLSGIAKRMIKNAEVFNVENPTDFDELLNKH